MSQTVEKIEQIEKIKLNIESLRQEIIHHKVYNQIKTAEDLKIFMQFHVYAVWDFMSLLKALQSNLTCTTSPWFPVGDADTRFLINEIVVGEEADIDMNGVRKSHFELYLSAMEQTGASTDEIKTFVSTLQQTSDFNKAFSDANTPIEAQEFVNFTFETINSKKSYLQAAVFTFGREDLIPNMFYTLVNDIHKNLPESVSEFKYYLERHIEVDGDHHSQLALQMTQNLCGNDDEIWSEVEHATINALKKRIQLWDGVYRVLTNHR